jgi:riboflavin kinase/FMN adenylyltransferase
LLERIIVEVYLTLKTLNELNLRKLKVYYSIDEVPVINNPVITMGTFDGVHLGHQKVIDFLKKNAAEINGETVLFTFHPHPRIVLNPEDHGLELIQTIEERIEKLASFGIDHLILFPFTFEFSRMTATEFIRDIMVAKLNVKIMTIGYNHHFGRNRTGNLNSLKELGEIYDFKVIEIPAFKVGEDQKNVSSTKIREAIRIGDISKATKFLGTYFSFSGIVVSGDKIGTKIGFPTANIKTKSPYQITPKSGVYAVYIKIKGTTYKGMMNIGFRPTIGENGDKRIEVHIFDFNQTIYDNNVSIEVVQMIRDEITFESLDKLTEQLKKDETNCLNILSAPAKL